VYIYSFLTDDLYDNIHLLFLVVVVLGFELKTSSLVSRQFYHWNHASNPFFALAVFQVGSYAFAQN
jgi:hypothetical protein